MKKGSAAAKAWGKKMKRLRNSNKSTSVTKHRKTKMAKKRRVVKRRAKRSFTSKALKPTGILAAGGIYGAARAKLSGLIAPYTNKIPLGNISDEAAMFAISYLVNKKGKGIVKQVGLMGMAVEAARLGEAVITGQVGLGGNATTPTGAIF